MAEVRLEGVTKRFGDVVAVQDMDLHAADGEFVVLVGPSGCGKTTTLRIVAGLEAPTQGKVYIGDREVTHIHPRERGVAMVFQDYALYPHMSVEENLSFGLRNLKYPKHEIRERVQQTAEMLQIMPLLKRKPRELSGGQRQRVALGRAMTRRPEVFLFDEPLSNLDAKLRVMMRVELAELHARLESTIIYVTHDQVEAMTLGQRIVVMNLGEVQQVGNATELYEHPANVFVAEFIGSPPMNLFAVNVRAESGHYYLSKGSLRIPLPESQAKYCVSHRDSQIVFGIRPEDIHCATSESGTLKRSRFTVRPKVVEMLGSINLVYFELDGVLMRASLNPDIKCRIGEPLQIEFNLSRAHLFDYNTGERVSSPANGSSE